MSVKLINRYSEAEMVMADDVLTALVSLSSNPDTAEIEQGIVFALAADFVAESESLEGHNTTAKDVMESRQLVAAGE